MKYYELDLVPRPIQDMDLELFRSKNIVKMLETGHHLPFIEAQNKKAVAYLNAQELEKSKSVLNKLSLIIDECKSQGIDIQDFQPYDLTEQGV